MMVTAKMLVDERYISYEVQEELERLRSIIPTAIKTRAARMLGAEPYQRIISKAHIYSAIEEIAEEGVEAINESPTLPSTPPGGYLVSDEDTDVICAFKNYFVTILLEDLDEDSNVQDLERFARERFQRFDISELDTIVESYRRDSRGD